MNDSAIICDEVIYADPKLSPKDHVDNNSNNVKLSPRDNETNFNEKKAICKTQIFYILPVIICCYFIIYRAKQFPYKIMN